MADRMMQRRDASLQDLRRTAVIPERDPDESFRTYYRRVAVAWLAAPGPRDPHHERTVRLILTREQRRHERSRQRRSSGLPSDELR